ncbi:sensor domain-containing protein [Alicyclobacillus ferrooxydans]|uniref:Diguanylate cyclase n=1 Tax=Alicyclobacillus ferrooxydans TaxID=471514 RepID=A0A0P9D549_9BACL|nr:EAL domain-containing protein [Alicyclobacillus ferrooxydans]KPV44564.1 hypothetical protein AN477_06070 [Alicyclobacillus ferrooxydans]
MDESCRLNFSLPVGHPEFSPNDHDVVRFQFETLINMMSDIVIFKDACGRWVEANDYAIQVFRLDDMPGSYIGKTDTEIARHSTVLAFFLKGCQMPDEQVWTAGTTISSVETMEFRDGRVNTYSITKVPTFQSDGSRKQLILFGRDITGEVEKSKQLSYSEQTFRSLFEHHPDPAFILSPSGHYIMENDATKRYVDTLIGYSYQDIVAKESFAEAVANFEATLRGETRVFQVDIRDQQRQTRQLIITNVPIIVSGQVVGVFGIAKDVTESIAAQNEIYQLAFVDHLTGLPNRRAFESQLDVCLKDAETTDIATILMEIDLDGFKHINDTFGHLVGDQLLVSIARRIEKCLNHNAFLARIGGDEFLVLVSHTTIDDSTHIADSILTAIRNPVVVEENTFYVTASIGISCSPIDDEQGVNLVKTTDIALYRAKENGKDQWQCYDPTMASESYRRFILKNDLQRGIARGELTLYYQPKIAPETEQIVGAEALVRWQHPDFGIVEPGYFIPMAEESGLITQLGNWVIREVTQQIQRWSALNVCTVPVSFNVSPKQLVQSEFVRTVVASLEAAGIEGVCIELEITESAMIHNDHVVDTIRMLQNRGIKVSVDDFGTGYSSFGQLRRHRFDALKVDKSFVDSIAFDKSSATLVKAMIQMAHDLGLRVIVEGVETREQVEILRDYGCDEIQGYYYSRPVPPEEFETLLRQGVTMA